MIVQFFLFVCGIYADEIGVLEVVSESLARNILGERDTDFCVIHLVDLLSIIMLRFLFGKVKRPISLLPPALHFLAHRIVFTLHLTQVAICRVTLFIQLYRKICMGLPQLLRA